LPPPGPCLFASNHQTYYDPLLVAAGQEEPLMFMAWDALFKGGRFEKLIRCFGAFPVDPEGRDPGGYRACLKFLRDGNRILIFPEGGRSADGGLMPFREGVARLAMKAGVPIVPVCIRGGERAWPRGDSAPRPWFAMSVTYLQHISPQSVRTPGERHAEAARLHKLLVERIEAVLQTPS
jgi:1-acyl-sn-glycerol-3-phosphate acyltransferase